MAEGPIKYSELFVPDNSIQDLAKQLREAADEYDRICDLITKTATKTAVMVAEIKSVRGPVAKALDDEKKKADELARARERLEAAQKGEMSELIDLKRRTKELTEVEKLQQIVVNSEEDSYERMSAQYRLNKLELNKYSKAERESNEEVKKKIKETEQLYIKMKAYQEATGKHALSVGDYGRATTSLVSDIRQAYQNMAIMQKEMKELEEAGQEDTQEYEDLRKSFLALSKDAAKLKRSFQLISAEENAMANKMGYLNDAIGVLGSSNGALSAAIGTMNLFGLTSDKAVEAQTKLQAVMAITNGLSAAYNALFQQGNILHGIRNIQDALSVKLKNKQAAATKKATVAQALLNAVAKANPLVILATIIVALTAALVIFTDKSKKAAKAMNTQLQVAEAYYNVLKALEKLMRADLDLMDKMIEGELNIANAAKKGYAVTDELEKRKLKNQQDILDMQKEIYKEDVRDLPKLRAEYVRLNQELERLSELGATHPNRKVMVQLDMNEAAKKLKVKDAIDILQKKANQIDNRISIAADIVTNEQSIKAQWETLFETIAQHNKEIVRSENDLVLESNIAREQLTEQRFARERKLATLNTQKEINELNRRLRDEANLTERGREAINDKIVSLQNKLWQDIREINQSEEQANLDAFREFEDAKIEAMAEGAEKQREALRTSYNRQINDLKIKYDKDESLTDEEKEYILQQIDEVRKAWTEASRQLELDIKIEALEAQREIVDAKLGLISEGTSKELELQLEALELERQQALAENQKLAEELRMDSLLINREYDHKALVLRVEHENNMSRKAFNVQKNYQDSLFGLIKTSSYRNARWQKKQQIKELQEEQKELENSLKVQSGEVRTNTEKTIQTVKNKITTLRQDLKGGKGKASGLMDLIGIPDDVAEAITDTSDVIVESIQRIADARAEAANAAVEAAKTEVDAAKTALDAEIEKRNQGYANNVADAHRNLALAKAEEAEALAIQKKAQREQAAINEASQVSELVTASAKIWGSLGFPLALAAIAAMWGSFAYSKSKASQLAKETYGDGTVELLSGGSHQSGHDISLGYKANGVERRAEGGEYFAIVNKRSSKKYGSEIPAIINALNAGNFEDIYSRNGKSSIFAVPAGTDVSGIRSDIHQLIDQGQNTVYTDSVGNTVIKRGNITRTIRKMAN